MCQDSCIYSCGHLCYETHFLCYLRCIYLNHSKIQVMHNAEKSPVELGRKHETLFCAWKCCAIYYLLFPSSTSSTEPYSGLEPVWTPEGLSRLWPEQSLKGQYLFISHIPGRFHFPPSADLTLKCCLAIWYPLATPKRLHFCLACLICRLHLPPHALVASFFQLTIGANAPLRLMLQRLTLPGRY